MTMMWLNGLSRPLTDSDFRQVLRPETDMEHQFLQEPEFVYGLGWGTPRYGHPEGEVYKHIREVLNNIDQLELPASLRQDLRLIAFVHDTFKHKESKGYPRDWSRHHGVLARHFLERYLSQPLLLDITELHDEAYYAWRMEFLQQKPYASQLRLQQLLDRIAPDLQLFYLFFACDTYTGDKNPAPVKWFEQVVPGIQPVLFLQ